METMAIYWQRFKISTNYKVKAFSLEKSLRYILAGRFLTYLTVKRHKGGQFLQKFEFAVRKF